MSKLDLVMLSALPEGTAIRVDVTRRGESLHLRAELVHRVTREGIPAESAHTIHEETGPGRQVVSSLHRWIGENVADVQTKRS